jgi:hypothetical protein
MLASHPKGVLVTAWVVPGASRDEVVGEHDGALTVRTVAPAEGGKANRRVAELIAQALGGRSGIVASGSSSRRKQVVVFGVTLSAASAALGVVPHRR